MDVLFEIGQEIVCVDASTTLGVKAPLIEGNQYTVKGFFGCTCGCISVDVGIRSFSGTLVCTKCSTRHETNDAWYFKQSRFAPLSHTDNVNELMEEVSYAGQRI